MNNIMRNWCLYFHDFRCCDFSPTSLVSETEFPPHLCVDYVLFIGDFRVLCLLSSFILAGFWAVHFSSHFSMCPSSVLPPFFLIPSAILLLLPSEVKFLESLVVSWTQSDSSDPSRRSCIFGAFFPVFLSWGRSRYSPWREWKDSWHTAGNFFLLFVSNHINKIFQSPEIWFFTRAWWRIHLIEGNLEHSYPGSPRLLASGWFARGCPEPWSAAEDPPASYHFLGYVSSFLDQLYSEKFSHHFINRAVTSCCFCFFSHFHSSVSKVVINVSSSLVFQGRHSYWVWLDPTWYFGKSDL